MVHRTSGTAFRVHFRVHPKEETSPGLTKSEETKRRMFLPIRVHVMGCWDDGHMTNYQKWSKTKVVALDCSFLNQLELCSKVLPLRRYEVKDFQKRRVFFCFLCFSP